MGIHKRIKAIRETKKISQSYLANELNLDQSQYSRREKGEIKFIPEELMKISKLLQISISELFGEKINENESISLKLIEQYECRIKEKDEMILVLKQLNKVQKRD